MHTDTSCDQLFMMTGRVWLEDGSFEYALVKEVESGQGGGDVVRQRRGRDGRTRGQIS